MAGTRLRIRAKGIRVAARKMKKVSAAINNETTDEMKVRIKDVEKEAKRIVPRKTANTQRTIASEVEEDAKKGPIGLVGANSPQSPRLEDPKKGLKHATRTGFIGRPTPFMLPALKRNQRAISAGIGKAVVRGARKGSK